MIFVDTNYFIRFLLKDNPKQYEIAKQLFLQAARTQVELITSIVVFFEVAWVLEKSYAEDKQSLTEKLYKMVNLNLELENREIIIEALNMFLENNLELIDCYNLVFSKYKELTDFKTFDKKLLKKFKQL